jgi:hypothetical protein
LDLAANEGFGLWFAEQQDFSPANPRRNRDTAKNPFSRSRCIWHGQFLQWERSLEKNESSGQGQSTPNRRRASAFV